MTLFRHIPKTSPRDVLAWVAAAWRYLCPIRLFEAKKFISLTLLMCCIVYNYNTLRGLKDTIVVTSIGAEVISVIELFGVLPSAVLMMFIYMKLTNIMTRARIFYLFGGCFIAFYAFFALVLYPHPDYFHISHDTIEHYATLYPSLKWHLRIIGKWSFALFYVVTELWCALMLNLLFWEFANHITRTNEAMRYYPLLGFVSNGAIILAGYTLAYASSHAAGAPVEANVSMVQMIIACIILSAIIMLGIYTWITRYVLTDPLLYTPREVKESVKHKRSLWKSLQLLGSSRYLQLIAILVLSYGISINLVEVPWKAKARLLYPAQMDYAAFMGQYIQYQGLVLIPVMLGGSLIIRRLGWFAGAIATPLVMIVTGVVFYMFLVFEKGVSGFTDMVFHLQPLTLAVYMGAAQIILSKATKYSMFDPTKEMVYIPIGHEFRTKGKSAVDMVGGRLSRSGGAIIQSGIFMIFPTASYDNVVPFLMCIFVVIMVIWLRAVKQLHYEYLALTPPDESKPSL